MTEQDTNTRSLLNSPFPLQSTKNTAPHIHIHSITSCTVKEAIKLYFLTQISFLIAATSTIHIPVIRQCKLNYPSNKKYILKNEDIFYLHISWEQ